MLDAILNGTEVGIGHGNPIPKVKLDVRPLQITLQQEAAVGLGLFTWSSLIPGASGSSPLDLQVHPEG